MLFRSSRVNGRRYVNDNSKKLAQPSANYGHIVGIVSALIASAAAVISAMGAAWWTTEYDSKKEDQKIEQAAIEAIAELSECVAIYGQTASDWQVAKELIGDQKPTEKYVNDLPIICGSVKSHPMFLGQILDNPKRLEKAVKRLCYTTHSLLLKSANDFLQNVQPSKEGINEGAAVEKALRQAQFVGVNLQFGLDVFNNAVRRMDMQCPYDFDRLRLSFIDELAIKNAKLNGATTNAKKGSIRSNEVALESSYGFRVNPLTGKVTLHDGQDFVAPVGTSIFTAKAGFVSRAEFDSRYGLVVEVSSIPNLVVRYAHLSKINVIKGQTLKEGDLVGALGQTGRASGPHLHVATFVNGAPRDPLDFVDKQMIFKPSNNESRS